MLNIPQEDQAILDEHIREASRLLRKYTDPEKLKDFETIEAEARKLVIEEVAPKVGEFFFSEGGEKTSGKQRRVKTCVGEVKISSSQGKKLGLKRKTPISPGLKKCCLRLCAKSSDQQAEEDLKP